MREMFHMAVPTPARKRRATRAGKCCRKTRPRVAREREMVPTTITGLRPKRSSIIPVGTSPTSVPNPAAATARETRA